jgi:hypothetical protein
MYIGVSMEKVNRPDLSFLREPEISSPQPPIDFAINNANTPAQLFFERLHDVIKAREAELGDSQELVWIAVCQNGKEYRVSQISYINPSLMHFYVFDETGEPCELLVNVSQVQFILKVVTLKDEQPKRKIGFIQPVISSG